MFKTKLDPIFLVSLNKLRLNDFEQVMDLVEHYIKCVLKNMFF